MIDYVTKHCIPISSVSSVSQDDEDDDEEEEEEQPKTDEQYIQGEAEEDAQLAWELFEVKCYPLRECVCVMYLFFLMYVRTSCPFSMNSFLY